ncbi:ABC transporter permease [Breznakiellaceae bacterium SP9]
METVETAGGKALTPLKWIGFVATRYVLRARKTSPAPVFSVLGIITGVLALTVIIAVMNGFQMGFIESILEISSYHVRIEEDSEDGSINNGFIEDIRALPGIVAAVPFRELQGILQGEQGGQQGAVIRGLPDNIADFDAGFTRLLDFEAGSLNIRGERSIILGRELARRLYTQVGEELSLVTIAGFFSGDDEDAEEIADDLLFTVTGIFRSGFYEYDMGWGFINIDTAAALAGDGEKEFLGIKLANQYDDTRALQRIKGLWDEKYQGRGVAEPTLSSWRNYNRAFFGALRTEKLMMLVLVGLIFIVVGLNIFQSQRKNILERREEIGLMRALGASSWAVRLIFIWDGFIIGLVGAGVGMGIGLLIANHIPQFFSVLEGIVNVFIGAINAVSGFFTGNESAQKFAVFAPKIFYIKEIPSRVIPLEVFLIFMFGFLSSLFAAFLASSKVSRTRPAEVLHDE